MQSLVVSSNFKELTDDEMQEINGGGFLIKTLIFIGGAIASEAIDQTIIQMTGSSIGTWVNRAMYPPNPPISNSSTQRNTNIVSNISPCSFPAR